MVVVGPLALKTPVESNKNVVTQSKSAECTGTTDYGNESEAGNLNHDKTSDLEQALIIIDN